MALQIGSSLFSTRMFKNSPEDSQILGFDGGTQRPGAPSSFFTGFSQTKFVRLAADDATIGTEAWDTLGNAYAEDGQTTNSHPNNDLEITHYLKATDFGFSIPPGAIILGIKVGIKKAAGDANSIKDYEVKIIRNGAIMTENKADTTGFYNTNVTWAYYGSATDLWGETWIADTINYNNFGVVISCKNWFGGAGYTDAVIDTIKIQVYYSG